ncbi:hypothetical protein JF546_13155 [Nitratireductor aquimarinus]|uniref:DUF6998 domain-containing protein n=1 Tax=Nitratireductor TaxID=245876 RepID=UPI001A8C3905|nr:MULTISPECIES: hypothetical protein [Nitratireductor]MBN8243963.1 hypothetical protein [Nitratireductor aquimarinus]MBY6131497.1 hypothetical protein [Nitratireductor aquimarinus]MCA1301033.1 hypothetical protein [Nitratireductor aquimarinus]MDJ1463391.1 hypothetical protein [Nitratireductor sp. GZWM139]
MSIFRKGAKRTITLSKAMMEIARAQERLAKESKGLKKFTLDGMLVGDIGEVLAHKHFGIEIHKPIRHGVDGVCPRGYPVQVKATGTGGGPVLNLSYPLQTDQRLLFFELDFKTGNAHVIFNGPEQIARSMVPPTSTSRRLTPKQIRKADLLVDDKDRIPRVR